MKKRLFNILLLLFIALTSFGQDPSWNGFIKDYSGYKFKTFQNRSGSYALDTTTDVTIDSVDVGEMWWNEPENTVAIKKHNGVINIGEEFDTKGMSYTDSIIASLASGGVKAWYFTKLLSGISTYYLAQDTIPTSPLQTITSTATDGESTVATFITPAEVYRVTEGNRTFYFNAKISDASKDVQLRGDIYLCNLAGNYQTLLRTSSLTPTLTESMAMYQTNVYGNSLLINDTTRIIFKVIAIKGNSAGTDPTVSLYVCDNTFSRLDVPVPSLALGEIVKDTIINGITDVAPSLNAVFDALTKKQNLLTNPVTGIGTANYIPKLTGTSTIGKSIIYENNGNIGIGTTNQTGKLEVRSTGLGVLKVYRDLAGAGGSMYSAVELGLTNTTPTDGNGIAFYFNCPNSTGAQLYPGLFGARFSTVLAGSEIGEIVFNPGWHGVNPNGSIATPALILRATGTSTSNALFASGGNVGINTTLPGNILDINCGTTGGVRYTYNDADGSATYYTDIKPTSTGMLYINPSGFNVGIGTSTPMSKLAVAISKTTNLNGFNWVNTDVNKGRTDIPTSTDTSSCHLSSTPTGNLTLHITGKDGSTQFQSDSTGLTVGGTLTYTGKLTNRIVVGTKGNYTTLKAAVDWFNVSATANTEILLDGGNHSITETVVVNNGTYALQIRGLGSAITYLNAATGLTNKPMLEIRSRCDINKLTMKGSTLASYGTLSTENAINFTTNNNVRSEISDIVIDGFNMALYDIIGDDIFLFNHVINNCTTAGVRINTSNSNQYLDMEVGTVYNCAIGVDLLKANTGGFFLTGVFFNNVGTQIGVKYTGGTGNYVYSGICNISNCTYNNTGTFISGFSFNGSETPIGRDKDIVIVNNPGLEDKNPHAKIRILNNATTTTVTTAGTFYKAAGFLAVTNLVFNVAATAGTFTYTVGDQTTGTIAYNASAATIKTAIEALSNVTTVTVTQVVASKEWNISFNTQDEGWVHQSCNVAGLTTTTSANVRSGSYQTKWTVTNNRVRYQPANTRDAEMWVSCNVISSTNARTIDIAIVKNGDVKNGIMGQMSCYCATGSQAYPVTTPVYIEDAAPNDYFEIWITANNNGNTVIVQDVSWMIESK